MITNRLTELARLKTDDAAVASALEPVNVIAPVVALNAMVPTSVLSVGAKPLPPRASLSALMSPAATVAAPVASGS